MIPLYRALERDLLKRLTNWLCRNRWVVVYCSFPYPPGFATYHLGKRMLLDTGLDYDRAIDLRDELNNQRGWFTHLTEKEE